MRTKSIIIIIVILFLTACAPVRTQTPAAQTILESTSTVTTATHSPTQMPSLTPTPIQTEKIVTPKLPEPLEDPNVVIGQLSGIELITYEDYTKPGSDWQRSIYRTPTGDAIRTAYFFITIYVDKNSKISLIIDSDEIESLLKEGGKMYKISGIVTKDLLDSRETIRTSRIVKSLLMQGYKIKLPEIKDVGQDLGRSFLAGYAPDWYGNTFGDENLSGYSMMIYEYDPVIGKVIDPLPKAIVIVRPDETLSQALERTAKALNLNMKNILFSLTCDTSQNLEAVATSKGETLIK